MQQIGLPIIPAIKLDNENIGGHYTPLQSIRTMRVKQRHVGLRETCTGYTSNAIIILYYARWQHKNKKNRAVKMKNTHNYRRKIKRKKQ